MSQEPVHPNPAEKILGFSISTESLSACIEKVMRWLDDDGSRYFVCANPHSLVTALRDPAFAEAIHAADLVTPDGAGIVLASRWRGGAIRRRITGSDVFDELSHRMSEKGGYSVFFLGASVDTLAVIQSKMQTLYPGIRLAGVYSPPFRDQFSEQDCVAMRAAVNAAKPDVLWVGMTAPKQEKWIYQNIGQLEVRFVGAIGAVFDFFSGRVKRPSPVFQNLGLEWLPRLIGEPRRLWQRTFVSGSRFLWLALKQRQD